jgi:hypothetical protein
MRSTRYRSPIFGRASISTAVVLMAAGGIIAFGIRFPEQVEEYVDVMDLGLILIWSGLLILVMQVVMRRAPRRRARRFSAYDAEVTSDNYYEHDVHRPGYAGRTHQLPTIRDR